MIIKLDYQDNNLIALKTLYKGKEKYHYIRYVVDEYSIDEAIQKIKGNKWVVALDYEGDLQHLFLLNEKPNVPIIVTRVVEDENVINTLSIGFMRNNIPDWVILSIKTPATFCNMKIVEEISKEFSNVRFCGGKFLRLPNCNIGCICRSNIPNKISKNEIKYYTEGCACILVSMHEEDVEGLEYIYDDNIMEDKLSNDTEQKKIIKSLDDLFRL